MADSNLNSVHLDFPRRDHFRLARDVLLSARGTQTVSVENSGGNWPAVGSHTFIQSLHKGVPPGVKHCLMDHEGVYPLKTGVNTIGRLPDNDVVLATPYVSRRHCAILVHTSDRCELHDIASKNGTFINGKKLAGPTVLVSGDEIRMCDRQFIYLTKQDPDNPHPATCTDVQDP